MSQKTLSFCFILVLAAFTALPAFAQNEVKDSYYFMKDDGVFSDEEKDEEAQYVHDACQYNYIQKAYFDCACIAGAFRQERDKGPLQPQSTILNSLFTDNQRGCANTLEIAGKTYTSCQEYARVFRAREADNEKYCKCVANTVANEFEKEPYLDMDYIDDLKTDAMMSCKEK